MISSPTNSIELPPLAQYKPISSYVPQYSDFIVWTGWLTTWHGIVTNYDKDTNELYVIFSNIPYLLFTMPDSEQVKETLKIKLDKILSSNPGTYAILQHSHNHNVNIWYI